MAIRGENWVTFCSFFDEGLMRVEQQKRPTNVNCAIEHFSPFFANVNFARHLHDISSPNHFIHVINLSDILPVGRSRRSLRLCHFLGDKRWYGQQLVSCIIVYSLVKLACYTVSYVHSFSATYQMKILRCYMKIFGCQVYWCQACIKFLESMR